MSGRERKVSRKMLFICLTLAGVVLLLTPSGITDSFQLAFTNIFSVPLNIARTITLSAQTGLSKSRLTRTHRVNKLQNHIANLRQQLEQEKKKVEKLAKIKNRTGLEGASFVYAGIITSSLTGPKNRMVINRGTADDVHKGQFVLGVNNIIGQVSAVSEHSAKIKLLTDKNSRLPVKLAGKETILEGAGNNIAEINMLPAENKIETGEPVYIRKHPGKLDTPMITGRVSGYSKNSRHPLLWDITVEPACMVENLSSVVVIVMNRRTGKVE